MTVALDVVRFCCGMGIGVFPYLYAHQYGFEQAVLVSLGILGVLVFMIAFDLWRVMGRLGFKD